jgi:hydroxymethylglutaryl-CoA lyase
VSDRVTIREVGPRDGMQAEEPVTPATRADLVDRLAACGMPVVEAAAFVSPSKVPSMAGADEVFGLITRRKGTQFVALVPNRRGAEMAVEAGVDGLTVTLSASDAYSHRNVGRSSAAAEEEVLLLAQHAPPELPAGIDVVVSCAFGSPYGEEITVDDVAALVARLRAAALSVTLADTTGEATPASVRHMVSTVDPSVGLHLHDTRHTALLNAFVAIEAGVRRFDTSIGGLGGSPFADGAAGNLATEDLVHLLDDLGLESGVSLEGLLEECRRLPQLLGHDLASTLGAVGPAAGSARRP